MTEAELNAIVDGIAPVIREYQSTMTARVATLERQIETLAAKPYVKFCGVWKAGTDYGPGDAATHQGGLWICQIATPGEPSKDFVGWQLAVKSGGGAMTAADWRQVQTALTPVIDQALAPLEADVITYCRDRAVPPAVCAEVCAGLRDRVRAECLAVVRALLMPAQVH